VVLVVADTTGAEATEVLTRARPYFAWMEDTNDDREKRVRGPPDEAGPRTAGETAGDEADRERSDSVDPSPTCHRRGCTEPATFVVLERYQEDTGHGAVEAEALLCEDHTDEESPTNLDGVYADYVFRVQPIDETP
jgi:hypothetical protein